MSFSEKFKIPCIKNAKCKIKGSQKEVAQVMPEAGSPLVKVAEILRDEKSFLITSHVRPDGDAIGSQLALASLLREMGKTVIIVDADPVPDTFRFLPGSDIIINAFTSQDYPEVALVLDTGSLDRTGRVADLVRKARLIINIDHHMSNDKFGNINLVEEKVGATGELVFSIICSLGFPVGKERAISLYAAIFTDTGSFQYANTTENTHRIVSCLLKEGVDPAEMAERVCQRPSFPRQKLLGLVLTTLRKNSQDRIAWSRLTREMGREAEAKDSETGGFIDYVQSIKGIELALLFQETDRKDHIKVSFRAKGEINVNNLARRFGGGGHKRAAGCLIKGSMEEVEKKVLTMAREQVE